MKLAIDYLRELLAAGEVDFERFDRALDQMLSAGTDEALRRAVRSLPPPVAITTASRRREEPFEINAFMSSVHLDGRWQVGRLTKIQAGMGSVVVELREAEFDEMEVEIAIHTGMGSVTVTVPRGFDVRFIGENGAVSAALDPPVPGFPVVRLSILSDMGSIRVVHPGRVMHSPKRTRLLGLSRLHRGRRKTLP